MRRIRVSLFACISGGLVSLAFPPATLASRGVIAVSRASCPASIKANDAGYSACNPSGGTPLTVTTTVVVPKIKSCTHQNQSVLAGSETDFEVQASDGYFANGWYDAGVWVECVKGKARYQLSGNGKSTTAHAGDKVVITQTFVSRTKRTATVIDKARGATTRYSQILPKGDSFKFFSPGVIGVLSPTGSAVPNFGTMQFTNSKINNKALDTYQDMRWDRYNGSTLQIKTTAFATNNSFKTIFKHH